MSKPSQQDKGPSNAYSAPTLKVYGDITKLTASGTGTATETPGNKDIAKKP